MEAVAMDKLIEKGGATPQLAQAIGEALDITLKAANVVTVPMLDARLAQHEAKMEARFSALERALESTKVWAVLLYAGLLVAFFGALAAGGGSNGRQARSAPLAAHQPLAETVIRRSVRRDATADRVSGWRDSHPGCVSYAS
ncbi:MAG: hypothetical protein JWL65_3245 [Gammaproteobacteria bacterium]|nr:hypothetical protein [Gammaproteobacteria bacterium]